MSTCLMARYEGFECRCEKCEEMTKSQIAFRDYRHLSKERAALVREWLTALTDSSDSPYWCGGILHVQVDDYNFEFDSGIEDHGGEFYGRPFTDAERKMCAAWDAMTLDERVLGVALWEAAPTLKG